MPLGLEELTNAERAVRINAPRKVNPELVFLPYLSRVHLTCIGNGFSEAFSGGAEHRLAKPQPLGVVGFIRVDIVTFAPYTHRQHIVGEIRGFTPRRRQRNM